MHVASVSDLLERLRRVSESHDFELVAPFVGGKAGGVRGEHLHDVPSRHDPLGEPRDECTSGVTREARKVVGDDEDAHRGREEERCAA